MILRALGSAVALALLLGACAEERSDPLLPPERAPVVDSAAESEPAPEAASETVAAADPTPGPEQAEAAAVPHIYMALQPDSAGPVSVILAIDRSRDNTPSDDPAIRLTPVNGQCNPQQLRWHDFPPEQAGAPAYGPDDAARGIPARELPEFMATAVTSEMLAAGLIDDPEQSQPQNVCTRKLLQRMMIDESGATS